MGRVREACREKDPGCSGGYREHGVSERGRQLSWLPPPFIVFIKKTASWKLWFDRQISTPKRILNPLEVSLYQLVTSADAQNDADSCINYTCYRFHLNPNSLTLLVDDPSLLAHDR